jgi:hypothetical protein
MEREEATAILALNRPERNDSSELSDDAKNRTGYTKGWTGWATEVLTFAGKGQAFM